MPPLLYLLSLGNLVIGSSAFVVSGLVDPIARDLGVSVPAAGQAMTVYALATAVLAPMALLATAAWPRRRTMLAALAFFLLGNLVCLTAGSLTQLLAGRVLMGIGSVFTPLAATLALSLVPGARRGQALALVFLGMSMSYVIGVPLGAWIGLRFGWPAAIGLMAAANLVLLAALAWRMPADAPAPAQGLRGLGAALRRPGVRSVLAVTLLYFSAVFIVFSYIAPVLTSLVPMDDLDLSLTLSCFGLAGMAGTVLGGKATDRYGIESTMKVLILVLAAMMALLPLTAGQRWPMLAVLACWGFAGFGMTAPQQNRLAQAAPDQAPLLLSLNASMLYIGMALGAALGGAAVGLMGFARLPWVAAPLAAMAGALVWFSARPRRTVALQSGPRPTLDLSQPEEPPR